GPSGPRGRPPPPGIAELGEDLAGFDALAGLALARLDQLGEGAGDLGARLLVPVRAPGHLARQPDEGLHPLLRLEGPDRLQLRSDVDGQAILLWDTEAPLHPGRAATRVTRPAVPLPPTRRGGGGRCAGLQPMITRHASGQRARRAFDRMSTK